MSSPRPRRALVLGAGGPLGAAWTIGALCALEAARQLDVRECEVLIGTSAGAVVGALLAGGARPADLRDHLLGHPGAGGPLAGIPFDYGATGGTLPPLPHPRLGSPKLLSRWLRNPLDYSPIVALSALAPRGRASLHSVREVLEHVRSADGWSPHPGLQVVAMDYATGARTVFAVDEPEDPPVDLADAVAASCAVPGWFPPVEVNGRRYVDGGVLSATHADLVAGLGMDEVYVLAPTAAADSAEATAAMPKWQRLIRAAMRRQLLREAAVLREDGTKAVLLAPGPLDLAVMGANMMDPARRVPVLETAEASTAATLTGITEGRARLSA